MRIAISNIAWDVAEDGAVADILAARQVELIDVAPGKYFPDPSVATAAQAQQVRQWWQDRGIAIWGMQALLFGTSGLNLFGPAEVQQRMLDRLAHVCRVARDLGVGPLVFGSPKNRDRSGLTDDEVDRVAISFFRRLGDIAAANGVTICLEPNPARYSCNFMTDSAQAARIVERVDHPAIRMQLDTGAVTINGEDPHEVIGRFAGLFGHVHASEPDLVPLGDGGCDHATIAAALRSRRSESVVSIEMVATSGESHPGSITRALDVALSTYGEREPR